jgi:formate dehydrogenase subunit gamma
VYGALTFYHDLHTEPRGRHRLQVCRAEACQSLGANDVIEQATARLGVGLGDTSPDGAYTLEPVFCLGNCALGPAAMVDGRLLGRMTADRLVETASALGADEEGSR